MAGGVLPTSARVDGLSGERFGVHYAILGEAAEARQRVEGICLEQTVEFAADLLPAGDIPDQLVGRVEQFGPLGDDRFEVAISYAFEVAGAELPQLLSVVFGNSSIKPGIRVVRLDLPERLLAGFR